VTESRLAEERAVLYKRPVSSATQRDRVASEGSRPLGTTTALAGLRSAAPSALRGRPARWLRIFVGAARMQLQTTAANVEDATWVVTEPLLAVVAVAVLVHAGRADLASHALSASCLMTIGQMGFWVGSDVLSTERTRETLELTVISPAPFSLLLFARILVISAFGLFGFAEGWLIVRGLFGLTITLHHPILLVVTLLGTLLAATCTSVLMAALFSMARTARTLQFAMYGPLYLLGGVLVPVSYLPSWLRPLAPFVFLSWSADLMRDVFRAEAPRDVYFRLGMLAALAVAAAAVAALITTRILNRLRRAGTLGVS
jgi:ABC-2 type transport system permease protein